MFQQIFFENSHSRPEIKPFAGVCDILECGNADPEYRKNIVTGDETLVYSYNPEPKSQWKHHNLHSQG